MPESGRCHSVCTLLSTAQSWGSVYLCSNSIGQAKVILHFPNRLCISFLQFRTACLKRVPWRLKDFIQMTNLPLLNLWLRPSTERYLISLFIYMFPDDPSLGLHIIVSPWVVLHAYTVSWHQGWGRKDSCFHISLCKGTVSRAFDVSFFTCLFLSSDRLSQSWLIFSKSRRNRKHLQLHIHTIEENEKFGITMN
jgi:hypothetical protein